MYVEEFIETKIEKESEDRKACNRDIQADQELQKKADEHGSQPRLSFHLKGVLDSGDPKLFFPSDPIKKEILDKPDSDLEAAIETLTKQLEKSPYIALAAPQFEIHKRLIVLYNTPLKNPDYPRIESIPLEVWANPKISYVEGARLVPDWEKYATNPDQEVLVPAYDKIHISGRCRRKDSMEFMPIENEVAEHWRARAFQALICYLDGKLPSERVAHPRFNISLSAYEQHWKGGVPFRIRNVKSQPPDIETNDELRKQLQPIINNLWQTNPVMHNQAFDLVGFIHFSNELAITEELECELSTFLNDSFNRPQPYIEKSLTDDTSIKVFRLGLTANNMSVYDRSADLFDDSLHNSSRRGSSSPAEDGEAVTSSGEITMTILPPSPFHVATLYDSEDHDVGIVHVTEDDLGLTIKIHHKYLAAWQDTSDEIRQFSERLRIEIWPDHTIHLISDIDAEQDEEDYELSELVAQQSHGTLRMAYHMHGIEASHYAQMDVTRREKNTRSTVPAEQVLEEDVALLRKMRDSK